MTERMTSIYLPSLGLGSGWQEYGRQTHARMVYKMRQNAEIAKEEAQRILDATDDEFVVETYLGSIVQRQREMIRPESPVHQSTEGEHNG